MRTGLTFDEYVDVKFRPSPRADRAFHEGAEVKRDGMFPMTTAETSTYLRSRGYDCRPAMLELLVENGTIMLAEPDTWPREDVDAAAERCEEHEMFVAFWGTVIFPSLNLMTFSAMVRKSFPVKLSLLRTSSMRSSQETWP